MLKNYLTFSFLAAALVLVASAHAAIKIAAVEVGDPGNSHHTDRWGAVDYTFHIGTYPVTNAQYVVFLNSVAATDPHGLFNPEMTTSIHGGITRSGESGSFTYHVKEGFGNKPVNFVSFWDAARFANWLTNGQPTGPQNANTTEAGMYFLGGLTHPNLTATARNEAAWNAGGVALPTVDEWFKAAYYDPTKGDSGGGFWNYWNYPTRSNLVPTASIPNSMNANSANCANVVGTVTDVGAYTLARSYYGTYDQGGNVWEWYAPAAGGFPNQRGGSFNTDAYSLSTNHGSGSGPSTEVAHFGFRVTSLTTIGEPSTADLVELTLERSSDLRTWESIHLTPDLITEGGKLRLPASDDAGFFRLRME